MKDDDGAEVSSGDWITFSYGIPPTRVDAKLSSRGGVLWGTVLGKHKPREFALRTLQHHVGSWYKSDGPAYQR